MRCTWAPAYAHGHVQVGRLAVVVHVECAFIQTDVEAGGWVSDGRALSLSCVVALRRNCHSATHLKLPMVPRVESLSGHLMVVVRFVCFASNFKPTPCTL